MIIAAIFLLGMVNFALHTAVLASGHPMMARLPGAARPDGAPAGFRITLLLEFAVLLAAMGLAAGGWTSVVWGYAFYSLLNAGCAWAILTGRI